MEIRGIRQAVWARWAVGTALSTLAAVTPSLAWAQTDGTAIPTAAVEAPRSQGLQDIVVTARRVQENLQTVPISIGALTNEDLESRQINNIMDLKGSVASLSTSRTTTPGSGYIAIRGNLGVALPTPASDSGVGLYFDGVYIGRSQGIGANIPDLARAEVLRGPQGTLFGRNNSSGAINFITNVPSNELEVKGSILYGNYDRLMGQAIVNLPLTEGFAVRFVYQHDEFRGDVRNTTTSPGYDFGQYGSMTPIRTFGGSNSEAFIFRARFTGIDGLTLDYKYDNTDAVEGSGANQLIGFTPSALAPTLASLFPVQLPGAVVQSFTRLGALSEGFQSAAPIKNSGHMVQAELELSDPLSVKSITSWRKTASGVFADLDGADWSILLPPTFARLPFCVSCSRNRLSQSQFSEELQLIGDYTDFSFIGGLFYFVENSRFINIYPTGTVVPERPAIYVPPTTAFVGAAPGPFALGEDGAYRNRSWAGYGHAEYDFNEQFKLAVGARYTIDKRETEDFRSFAVNRESDVKYERFTWDAALNFQMTPDHLLYAKYATGYISGGIFAGISYEPESSKQAEIGFKGEFLDRRLRVNAAAYYTWVEDRQNALPSVNPLSNPVLSASGYTAPFPLGILLFNLPGTTKIPGFEIETTLVPVERMTLTANFGYSDPKQPDRGRNRSPNTTFSFSGQYDFPEFSNGSYFSVRLDGDYRGKYYGTGANLDAVFQGEVPAALRPGYATSAAYLADLAEASIAGDYWLVNGRLSLADFPVSSGTARLSGFVRNIFNEKGLLYSVNYGYSIHGSFERPRTYGAELSFSF
jgi:iron complex outermembrane receptor protein